MERRETLRRRLEIELLGGPEPRVKVEEAGWSWLHPLVDQRCFEKVVEINLSYAERYDYAKLTVPKEHKEITLDAKLLDAYVGQYQLAPGAIMTVSAGSTFGCSRRW